MLIKALKMLLISLVIILVALCVAGYFLLTGMCENTLTASAISPNGKWQVVLFERNCGTTTDFSSQISLLRADEELPNESGNVFIAADRPIGYSLAWKTDNSVLIKTVGARWYKKETTLNDVDFSYE